MRFLFMLSSFAVVVSTAGVCNAKVAQEPPRSNASDGGELSSDGVVDE